MKKKFYAVVRGRTLGVLTSCDAFKKSTSGFTNALGKVFSSIDQAQKFISDGSYKSKPKKRQKIVSDQHKSGSTRKSVQSVNKSSPVVEKKKQKKKTTKNNVEYYFPEHTFDICLQHTASSKGFSFFFSMPEFIKLAISKAEADEDLILYTDGGVLNGCCGGGVALQIPINHQDFKYLLLIASYAFKSFFGDNNWTEIFSIIRGFEELRYISLASSIPITTEKKNLYIICDNINALHILSLQSNNSKCHIIQQTLTKWLKIEGDKMGLKSIIFTWCKGHKDLIGNVLTDKLAAQGEIYSRQEQIQPDNCHRHNYHVILSKDSIQNGGLSKCSNLFECHSIDSKTFQNFPLIG